MMFTCLKRILDFDSISTDFKRFHIAMISPSNSSRFGSRRFTIDRKEKRYLLPHYEYSNREILRNEPFFGGIVSL